MCARYVEGRILGILDNVPIPLLTLKRPLSLDTCPSHHTVVKWMLSVVIEPREVHVRNHFNNWMNRQAIGARGGGNYYQAMDTFFSYLYEVMKVDCDERMLNHKKLVRYHPKSHVEDEMKWKLCAYGLVSFGLGTGFNYRQNLTCLRNMTSMQTHPAAPQAQMLDRLCYAFFMLPCLRVAQVMLNPTRVLQHEKILDKINPTNWFVEGPNKRVRKYGVWSERFLLLAETEQIPHYEDGWVPEMVRGVYLPYVKILNQFQRNRIVIGKATFCLEEEWAAIKGGYEGEFNLTKNMFHLYPNYRPLHRDAFVHFPEIVPNNAGTTATWGHYNMVESPQNPY